MADASAARKQAEGAHRHVEGLLPQDPKVKIDKRKFFELFCFVCIENRFSR